VEAVNSPRAHDGGFFLRLSAGVGTASTSADDPDFGEWEISGVSGDVNFAIGGIVSPNLALHGTLWGWSTTDPDVELDGDDAGTLNGDLSVSAIGAGLTYYFMPSNLYLSGSLGLASMSIDTDLGDFGSDTGLAVDITLGKEWWVGRSWGLGIAGALGLHSVGAEDIEENWSGASFGLRFSATMN
jgi:hypothetical protein